MSRSKNQHKKTWCWPLHEAQKWSNVTRRAYGKQLITAYTKAIDTDDVELADQISKDAKAGDIWCWD